MKEIADKHNGKIQILFANAGVNGIHPRSAIFLVVTFVGISFGRHGIFNQLVACPIYHLITGSVVW